MSDVTVAPNASPPPTNNEVRVEPNQAQLPTPVGSQAPDKPADAEQRPLSRRESIQRAFDRAAQAKPAEAKMGHNQPPEPMAKEKPKAAPPKERPNADPEKSTLNLRKRPSDQEAEDKPAREPAQRAEHGHFAPREGAQKVAQSAQNNAQQPSPGAPAHTQPLPRMSQAAKTEWAKVPQSVQADIHRLHNEFGRAYQRYRGDHETMNAIRPFHQMATQQGTTLARALQNYTGMEHKLRNDVVGGLDLIIDNLNLRTPDGRKLTLPDVAWHIVNQTPEQRQLLQSRNTAMAQSHQLEQANQRIRALEHNTKQVQYAAAFHQTRSAVDQYAVSHPRLDELGDLIEQEVKLGFDLDTAYRRAELLRPATAAQTRTNGNTAAQTRSTTTAQTRTPDRSIGGAPGASNANGDARQKKPVGRREAIANAIKHVNASGSL